MNNSPEYKLDRVFNAPRKLVWQAWTDPELLHQWYGPGAETVIHEFDLKPGGKWLNEMRWGDKSLYQKVIFQKVTPPEKMTWHHYSSTDSEWNSAPNPMMADWPSILLTTVLFEEMGEQTSVKLSQLPIDATEAEATCFAAKMAGMDGGWGSGYAIMDNILADLQVKG